MSIDELPSETHARTPDRPREPGRSFARGLLVALPLAILLWGLIGWLV